MEDRSDFNIKLLFFFVLLIALGLRVINLGDTALGETELHWALQVLDASRGEQFALDGNAFYVFLTGLLFNTFGSSEFITRLLPAALGTFLAFSPYFFRKELGQRAALLISVGLAVDPGMVSLSRQAGSDMSAFGLLALCLILWKNRSDVWAGIVLALALLSGTSVIYGLIGVGIALSLASIRDKSEGLILEGGRLKKLIAPFLITMFIIGTWFSSNPSGLSSLGSNIINLIEKFTLKSVLPFGIILFSLAAFHPMGLTFGLIGAFNKKITDRTAKFAKWWLLISVIFVLVLPGSSAVDLAWAMIPLYILAGLALQRFVFRRSSVRGWVEILFVAILLVIGLFGYFNIVNLVRATPPFGANNLIDSLLRFQLSDWGNYDRNVHTYILRWMMLPSIPVIVAMLTFIVTTIWSREQSTKGLGMGVFVFLAALSLSLSFRMSAGSLKVEDVWYSDGSSSEVSNLKEWIEWFGVINKGDIHELEIMVEDHSDQVAWQMRDFINLEYSQGEARIVLPEVVITPADDLSLTEFGLYSMQEIPIIMERIPSEGLYENALNWFVWMEEPLTSKSVNLWVRHDLFPSD